VKRIYSVAFLLVLLINSAGFYVYYVIQIRQIRSEMRAALKNLPKEQLDVLSLTPLQFQEAQVESHEIKVQGKMYDIAWTEEINGVITVYCKHDKKEDDLLALLDHVLSVPIEEKDAIPSVVSEFIALSFVKPSFQLELFTTYRSAKTITAYFFSTQTFLTAPLKHPPRCLSA
jgi:hypothetical protein